VVLYVAPKAVVPAAASRGAEDTLRVAMLGTRGVPAAYGGFETAVEEVGSRLAARGHEVTVYCRTTPGAERTATHLGMNLVHLPALRRKSLETLSHTGLSAAHLLLGRSHDAAIVFNAGNAPFLPVLRSRGIPVATHVDGLEWQRAKWEGIGRHYYRWAESMAVRWSDALIADAEGIADYYRTEFQAHTELIAYGAPVLRTRRARELAKMGITVGEYHLVVARFEPENHVHLILEGYRRSSARHPLVIVGSAPYSHGYTEHVRALAEADPRVQLLGPVWDQHLLDDLYAGAATYVHGHSVGGTNPSLLRAMGAGTAVLAYDVPFNREVAGGQGRYFGDAAELAALLERAEAHPHERDQRSVQLRERARSEYRWDDVADRYEDLCRRLSAGASSARGSGRRTHEASAFVRQSAWR